MSTDHYIRFTVKVLPPAREEEGAISPSEEPLRSLAIGAKPSETFKDLRCKIQIRAGALFKHGSEREGCVGQLHDSSGAEIFDGDDVGSLYDVLPFGQQHKLFVRLEASPVEHRAAGASSAAQQSSKRRASEEGLGQEREGAKRQKLAAVSDNGPAGGRQHTDADGFKAPATRAQNAAAGERGSSATVLVKDSQPEAETAGGELGIRKAHLRKPHTTSSPAPRSSPLLAAATRNQAPQNAGAQSAGTRKALPTPESRDWKRAHVAGDPPGQSTSKGPTMSSWFKRQTPTSKSALDHIVDQEDPIEDAEPDATKSRPAVENTIAGERERAADVPIDRSHGEFGPEDNQPPQKVALNGSAKNTVRTPSMHQSISTRTRDSHAPHSSQNDTIKNTARSVAHGWTKEEDDALLAGLSRKGMKVEDILKQYKIDRSVSAARSRKALLLSNRKGQQNNKLSFPSSSLAIPLSGSEEEPSLSAKSRVSRWSQSDIGALRKAIGDGMDPREIRSQLFGGRSEEAVNAKIRKIEPSVIKLEKSKTSFPKDAISWHQWTDTHSLKLRRAYREGLNVVAAGSRYFKGLPKTLVELKMKAYRQQMEDLAIEQDLSQSSKPALAGHPQDFIDVTATRDVGVDVSHGQAFERLVEADKDDVPQPYDDLDAEILRELDGDGDDNDEPVIQDSYETGSVNIASSPPLVRKVNRRVSPRVVIPPAEQLEARREQHGRWTGQTNLAPLLRRSTSSGGQMQLNFQREKGKGPVRPLVDLEQLNQQYRRHAPHRVFPQAKSSAAHGDAAVGSVEHEDSDAYTSTPKAGKQVQHLASDGLDSDATVSSGAPNRQLAFELEQSLSATEQSTQSQAAQAQQDHSTTPPTSPAVKRTAYVFIRSPKRPTAAQTPQMDQRQHTEENEPTPLAQDSATGVSQQQEGDLSSPKSKVKASRVERIQAVSDDSDSEPAFQTQDPKTVSLQTQRRMKATSKLNLKTKVDTQAQRSSGSDGDSLALQTQDPSTTLSQKRDIEPQSTAEPARKAGSMLRDAVNRYEASQHDAEPTPSAPSLDKPKPTVLSRSRRNVYDVPVSSQSAGDSQNLRQSRSTQQAPTSSEKRAPGQLPRIIGSASRLHMRRKEQEKLIAARRAEREARSSAQISSVTPSSHRGRNVDTNVSNNASTPVPPPADGPTSESPLHVEQAEPSQSRLERPKEAVTTTHHKPTSQKTLPDAEVDQDAEGDADAKVDVDDAFGETSQSQVQVQPIVELPYPQILSREPGPNGKLEIGRPGLSFKVPLDCAYLRDEEQLLAAASKHTSDPRAIKRLVQDMKLADQQAIAIACDDHDKLKVLHKQERRYRRERRVEEGLPPSRGPAPRFLQPGQPMGIQWDVNVMPDSDDSMSSRGRDMDDGDEMSGEEHGDSEELDDDDNAAYFDRSRHFSEVEDDSDEEQAEPAQRLITEAGDISPRSLEAGQNDTRGSADATQLHGNGDDAVDDAGRADKQAEESVASPADATEHSPTLNGAQTKGVDPIEDSVAVVEPSAVHEAADAAEASALDLISGSAAEAAESDDDAELPTAPPPMPDSIEENVEGNADIAPAPSDRELQELLQSGDDEMRDAPALPTTRLPPGLGSSPVEPSPSQETQDNTTFGNSFATTNFSPVDTRRPDEGTVEYWQRRNASPDRHPSITDSMLPPWPSSGKVRSSLEAPATQTPPVASGDGSNMASEKLHKHAASSRSGKKRKSDMTADELDEHRGSRSAKKARREEKKKSAEKQLPTSEPSANGSHADKHRAKDKNRIVDSTFPAQSAAPLPTIEPFASKNRKNKKKKKKSAPARIPHDDNSGVTVQQPSIQVEHKDRIAMPPPAIPVQHVHLAQQNSLPSPDSEFSTKARKAEKRAKKTKKRAERKARRISMSASVQDSTTSDMSFAMPVASSPPVVEKPTPTAAPAAPTVAQQPSAEDSPAASVEQPTKPSKTKKTKKHSNDEAFTEPSMEDKANLPTPAAASKSAARSESQSKSDERPGSSHKKKAKSSSQESLPTADDRKTKAIKTADTAPESSKTPSTKTAKSKSAPTKGQQVKESSTPKGNGSQPQVGASGGLKKLMGFQPHIPDAPKPLSPAAKGPAKARLVDDDTDEDESGSSSSGSE